MDTTSDDASLVGRAREGDMRAFSSLLARHGPLLEALCRRALPLGAMVEDAVQEAALQALLGLGKLHEPSRFGPWLGGIGLNVCRRWLTRSAREAWSWEAVYGGRVAADLPDDGPGPEELAEAADVAARVRYAVAELRPARRAAVVAFYLSGLTYRETASELGISVVATKGRLHKARDDLRPQLASFWEEYFMSAPDLIEVRVADVRRARDGGDRANHIVLLEETDGDRRLPIFIGRQEAWAILFALEDLQLPRPLVYDFMLKSLEAVGARLVEVRVERLVERTYYSVAIYEGKGESREVDARPSDALNLALRTGVSIRIRREAWEAGHGENERILATLDEVFPHRRRDVLPEPLEAPMTAEERESAGASAEPGPPEARV